MASLRARDLTPGNVLTKAGHTPHAPITVTEVRPSLRRTVQVFGFNEHNSEPRLMFRQLLGALPVEIEES